MSHRDTIVIIDYGSQYSHLIANRIRRLGVYSEIKEPNVPVESLKQYKGIILSGGPNDVTFPQAPRIDPVVFTFGIPILGICYGHQMIAHALGGTVKSGTTREYGRAVIDVQETGVLLKGLSRTEEVWMSHGDSVTQVPEGFTVLASTADCPVSAMEHPARKLYGTQFHPEVTHTLHGLKILENFVFTVCGSAKTWTMEQYVKDLELTIKETVGDRKVFLLVSGGVDSVVLFALLGKALGPERVYGLHIDTGFMRKDESSEIAAELTRAGFENLHIVDAEQTFYTALTGVAEPEAKRQVIGDTFLQVSDAAMKKLKLNPTEWVMAQGTIYPDTIETGRTKHADKIKTHHNRVPAAQEMIAQGTLLEPLSELYKDEVRELGTRLGLPDVLTERQPFPGPGLAVRILCQKAGEQVPDLSSLSRTVEEHAMGHGLKARVLPVKSVGVQGDNRTYAHPAVLMGNQGWEVLDRVSREITNTVYEVNRVVWWVETEATAGVRGMAPDFISEPAFLTRERVELARAADAAVHDVLRTHGILSKIWQCPVVLLPILVGGEEQGNIVVLRPVESREAMTANFYRMERRVLDAILMRLEAIPGIGAVFYDVTNKPPATIEWE